MTLQVEAAPRKHSSVKGKSGAVSLALGGKIHTMGTQPESRLSRKIMTGLRADGHFCFKVHGSELTMAGLPDIIVCANGLFIGFETKMPAKRTNTSPRQDYVHGLIRSARGIAMVVCSLDEARKVIKEVLDNPQPLI